MAGLTGLFMSVNADKASAQLPPAPSPLPPPTQRFVLFDTGMAKAPDAAYSTRFHIKAGSCVEVDDASRIINGHVYVRAFAPNETHFGLVDITALEDRIPGHKGCKAKTAAGPAPQRTATTAAAVQPQPLAPNFARAPFYIVAAREANVRNAPSGYADVTSTVPNGSCVHPFEAPRTAFGGYSRVTIHKPNGENRSGWMFDQDLRPAPADMTARNCFEAPAQTASTSALPQTRFYTVAIGQEPILHASNGLQYHIWPHSCLRVDGREGPFSNVTLTSRANGSVTGRVLSMNLSPLPSAPPACTADWRPVPPPGLGIR